MGTTDVTFEKIDDQEAWATFDRTAQRLLHLSGEDFAKRWDEGAYSDSDEIAVMRVAMLRPGGR